MNNIPTPAIFDTTMMAAQRAQAPQASNTPNVDKAAKEFEAMFISEMMSHMFSGLEVDPMFGGGHGEEMFRGFLIQEYGKQAAQGQGFGLADQLKSMMIQMQQNTKGV